MNFPRVLVIAPIKFNRQTGSGVTMGNLFRGWPLEAIAQIHSDGRNEPDYTVCNRYYDLLNRPVRQPGLPQMIASFVGQGGRFLLGREESLAGHWLRLNPILDWVREFEPDVIYARPHDRPSFFTWLPRTLSQALAIPYVTRVLDDWPARYESDPSPVKRLFWRLFVRRDLEALFHGATVNVGISAEMCEAFSRRYGADFVPFHNCIDVAEWQPKDSYHVQEEFRIVYIGSVTRDKELYSLVDLRDVLADLNREGHRLRLIIYGPDTYRELVKMHIEIPPLAIHGGCFPAGEKQKVLREADLLILPINFDEGSLAYMSYSFQTKVPEYMASGTPVLVYGPPTNPNVRYARRDGWGAVVDRRDKAWLAATVRCLVDDEGLRASLGQRARDLAFHHHDAAVVRRQFQQLIGDVAAGTYRLREENGRVQAWNSRQPEGRSDA
jgi:glycosyltransferase involved in cell wall biosynthesis